MRLLTILCAWPLLAQLTPSTLNFGKRFKGATPAIQDIVVTGSGAVTVNSCNDISGALCVRMLTNTADIVGTVHVYWDGYDVLTAVGSYQSTLSITRAGGTCSTNCTATINLSVADLTLDIFTTANSQPAVGCSNSNAFFQDTDTCTIADVRPGGSYTQPTIGNTVVDGNFGGVIRRVSNTNRTIDNDSITSPVNSDGTLVNTVTVSGSYIVTNTITGADPYTISYPKYRSRSWDPRNPNIWYYFDATTPTVHKITLPSQTDVTVATYSGSATDLTNGGDGKVTKDGVWCAYTNGGADKKVVIIFLDTGAVVSYDFSGVTTMSNPPRSCTISNRDLVSNKHYVMLGSYPVGAGLGGGSNSRFSVDATTHAIVNDGAVPLSPLAPALGSRYKIIPTTAADCTTGYCRPAVHGNDFVEVNGEQYWGVLYGVQLAGYISWDFAKMNMSLDLMEIAVENGGSRTYTFPINLNIADVHMGCATSAPICVMGQNDDPTLTGYEVTNVATGATTTVTTSPNYGGANGNVVLINNVGGVTGMVGPTLCTVASLSGATFNCSGMTTSGTYTASTGSLTLNVAPAAAPHQTDLLVLNLSAIATKAITVTRLLKTRSFGFTGTWLGLYNAQSHPGVSSDGKVVCWESSNGTPDNFDVYCAPTGYSPFGGRLVTGNAVIRGNIR